jgi:glucose uptake protein GlcU
MLAAALVLVLLGLLGLIVFPWGGIAAAAVGFILLVLYLVGIGRAAERSVSKDSARPAR